MSKAERSATELMQLYWAACRGRGEKPRKVHGLVSLGAPAEQPKGYVIAWGVLRGYVEAQHDKRSEPEKSGWEIQEFEPNV